VSRITVVVNGHGAPSETFQRSLAATLARAGHAVTIHALRPGRERPVPIEGVTLSEGLPASSSTRSLIANMGRGGASLVPVLRHAVRLFGPGPEAVRAALVAAPILQTEPDVVHLGFSGIGVAIGEALDLLGDVSLVVSCRGTDELVRPLTDPERGPALARLLGRVDRVHAVADAVARQVVALGAPPERVQVIRPAVDLDAWPVGDPPVGPPFELLSVGRLEAAKGHDDAMAALASVREAGVDARLTILGAGRHRDALVLRRARSGLDPVVHLVGSGSAVDVRRHLARTHLFVCASHSEGINNGVLEAMASGRAVIATDVGGNREVITDAKDGWLVAAARPEHLAARILAVLGDAPSREQVAAAGRRRVHEAFGLERQGDEWRDFYRSLPLAPTRAPRSVPAPEAFDR
jgi:glycosyltransferase involved in cell wall biosynthesis